jgi:hypothetical protein
VSEKSESPGSNNRWWESYLVRYFLGFIVGTICVAVIAQFTGVIPGFVTLMQDAGNPTGSGPRSGVTSIMIAVALLGMAYCYIASTPITVLHAGRYSRGPVERLSRFFWFGWVCALAFLMMVPSAATTMPDIGVYGYWTVSGMAVLAIIAWAWFRSGKQKSSSGGADSAGSGATGAGSQTGSAGGRAGSNPDSKYEEIDYLLVVPFFLAILSAAQAVPLGLGVRPLTADVRLLVLGAPVIWIGIVQYFVLFKIHRNEKANYAFYKNLFTARQRTGAKDVRDTYSHLREHSNAIFIVAVEISMLALVTGSIRVQPSAHGTSAFSSDIATFWLCALGIWIVPTVFMWSRANAMERYFADHPEEFIPKKSRKPLQGRPGSRSGASAGTAADAAAVQPVPSSVPAGDPPAESALSGASRQQVT